MRYILILLLFISGAASAQFAPTSAKTKFSNGIAIGSKDTSAFSAADTMVLTIARDSVMYYKYRGVWRPIATGGNLNNYKLMSDTLFNNGYTTRGRTKQYGDSIAVLKLNISDTAAMLANRLKISDTLTMLSKLSLDRVLINGNTSGRGVVLGTGSFTSSGSSSTVEINHLSGSGAALSISKDGNDEGLRVTKLSGSGNAATIIGTLNATALVKSGGTSSQFLMADGSVNTSVLPSGAYLPLSGGTLTGALSGTSLAMSGGATFGGQVRPITNFAADLGSSSFRWADIFASSANLSAGATLGGALNGTSATFSGATQLATSSGNVLIKTTTDNGTDALQVAGSGLFSGNVSLVPSGSVNATLSVSGSTGSYSGIVSLQRGGTEDGTLHAASTNFNPTSASVADLVLTAGGGGRNLRLATNNTIALTINSSQAATFSSTVTATGFIVSSDRRLKNIVSRSGDMVTYTLKNDNTKQLHYGYIAQEVEKTLPTTVSTDDKGMKAVNYIEVLVKKVNDLEKEIAELKKHNK
jgi:hypothetical protein